MTELQAVLEASVVLEELKKRMAELEGRVEALEGAEGDTEGGAELEADS